MVPNRFHHLKVILVVIRTRQSFSVVEQSTSKELIHPDRIPFKTETIRSPIHINDDLWTNKVTVGKFLGVRVFWKSGRTLKYALLTVTVYNPPYGIRPAEVSDTTSNADPDCKKSFNVWLFMTTIPHTSITHQKRYYTSQISVSWTWWSHRRDQTMKRQKQSLVIRQEMDTFQCKACTVRLPLPNKTQTCEVCTLEEPDEWWSYQHKIGNSFPLLYKVWQCVSIRPISSGQIERDFDGDYGEKTCED